MSTASASLGEHAMYMHPIKVPSSLGAELVSKHYMKLVKACRLYMRDIAAKNIYTDHKNHKEAIVEAALKAAYGDKVFRKINALLAEAIEKEQVLIEKI